MPRTASSLHDLLRAAVARAARTQEASRALIDQQHAVVLSIRETTVAADRRRRASRDVRKRTP